MTGSVLHVHQRDAGFTCAGDEEDPQRVRPDLGSAVERGATSQAAHHPPRLRLIHATAGLGDEQRASRATVQILVKRTYKRRSEDGSIAAAALALQAQDPMPSVMCKMFDVKVEGFTYTHTLCASRLSKAMLRRLPCSFAANSNRRNSARVSPGVSPRSPTFGRRTCFAGDVARTCSVTRKSYQLETDDRRRAIVRGSGRAPRATEPRRRCAAAGLSRVRRHARRKMRTMPPSRRCSSAAY
jgi:hypothetical protein